MRLIRHPHSNSCLGSLLLPLLATASVVLANTEKVIFTAPAPGPIIPLATTTSDLNLLNVLGPETKWAVRTNLSRVFPSSSTAAYQRGLPAWLLLDNLTEGQRYELRVCWSALEPTSFTLDIYPPDTVLQTPELLQSLSEYVSSLQANPPAINQTSSSSSPPSPSNKNGQRPSSVLLLRILAAADYFSDNQSLMKNPPPVLVDLILDPYLYNILPYSLLPTGGYIIAISIVAWFVAQYCARSLVSIANTGNDASDQRKKKN